MILLVTQFHIVAPEICANLAQSCCSTLRFEKVWPANSHRHHKLTALIMLQGHTRCDFCQQRPDHNPQLTSVHVRKQQHEVTKVYPKTHPHFLTCLQSGFVVAEIGEHEGHPRSQMSHCISCICVQALNMTSCRFSRPAR